MTRDEIKALLDAATPGPWHHEVDPNLDEDGFQERPPIATVIVDNDPMHRGPAAVCQIISPENAALIAAAPTALRELLGEVERLEARLGGAEDDLNDVIGERDEAIRQRDARPDVTVIRDLARTGYRALTAWAADEDHEIHPDAFAAFEMFRDLCGMTVCTHARMNALGNGECDTCADAALRAHAARGKGG